MKTKHSTEPKQDAPAWPKTYRHKQNKKKVRVMPWWEMVGPILTDEDMGDMAEGRKIKIGALVQVGYLLENENGIWFGVGPEALKHFTEVKKKFRTVKEK